MTSVAINDVSQVSSTELPTLCHSKPNRTK